MKLLVVIPSLHRGGAERVVSLLTQEWCKAHDVRVAVFDASEPAYAYGGTLIDLSIPAQTGAVGKITNALRRIFSLSGGIKRERPDRVISFMESANFPVIFAALMTGHLGKLSVSVHNDPGRFPFLYQLLIPLLYRLPKRVVAVSQGVAKALVDLGAPKDSLVAIPNPVPQNLHGDQMTRPEAAPARYILGVGRLHRQKGFDRLLKVFADIADHDLHLVILGEGGERVALEILANSLGVAARVHMPGAVADPMPWYQHADCFVLSSRYEGWGNVLLEAMSNGCPVVSFDCKYGPAEIIENEINGLLVEQDDICALRQSIMRVLRDEDFRLILIKAALTKANQFAADQLSKRWVV